jgi:hypothetical protein
VILKYEIIILLLLQYEISIILQLQYEIIEKGSWKWSTHRRLETSSKSALKDANAFLLHMQRFRRRLEASNKFPLSHIESEVKKYSDLPGSVQLHLDAQVRIDRLDVDCLLRDCLVDRMKRLLTPFKYDRTGRASMRDTILSDDHQTRHFDTNNTNAANSHNTNADNTNAVNSNNTNTANTNNTNAVNSNNTNAAPLSSESDSEHSSDFGIETVEEPPLTGEWVRSSRSLNDRVVLYFHGGAYVLMTPESTRIFSARMSWEWNAPVFSVDYRLAPETVYPGMF